MIGGRNVGVGSAWARDFFLLEAKNPFRLYFLCGVVRIMPNGVGVLI
jgi:hypothetical protein